MASSRGWPRAVGLRRDRCLPVQTRDGRPADRVQPCRRASAADRAAPMLRWCSPMVCALRPAPPSPSGRARSSARQRNSTLVVMPYARATTRDARAWPVAFQRHGALLVGVERAPGTSAVRRRVAAGSACQAAMCLRLLSAAASPSAYLRERAGMKACPPVDLDLPGVQQIAPSPQAVRRQSVRGGVVADAQPAPRHRLHMHRPERLHAAVAVVGGTAPRSPLAARLGVEAPLQTQAFRIREHLQPARERRRVEPMLTAVAALRQTAALPRLDMHRPPGLRRAVFSKCFDTAGDPPPHEGTRHGTTPHPDIEVSRPDAYDQDPRLRLLDKSRAGGRSYVPDSASHFAPCAGMAAGAGSDFVQ
jgi:hypothetical protein